MNGFDLDHPLPTKDCDVCGAENWWRCRCDPDMADVDAMFAPAPAEGDDDT